MSVLGGRSALFLMLLGVASIAGCLGGTSGDAIGEEGAAGGPLRTFEVATDPAGDAYHAAPSTLRPYCNALGGTPAHGVCRDALASPALAGVGVEAPPELDITRVGLEEHADVLVFDIELASIEQPLEDAMNFDGTSRIGFWSVDWRTAEDGDGSVYLFADYHWREAGEPARLAAWFDQYCAPEQPEAQDGSIECDVGCNWWWWCSSPVQYEVVWGTPGHLRLHVPWHALDRVGAAGDLFDVQASVSRMAQPTYALEPARLPWVGWRDNPAGLPLSHDPNYLLFVGFSQIDAIETIPGPIEVRPPSGLAVPDLATRTEATPGDTAGAYYDLLAVEWLETPTTLAIAFEIADVVATPPDHGVYAALGFPSGRVYEFGYDASGGVREPWGGYPNDVEYTTYPSLPVRLDVEPGAPGRVTLTVARDDIEPLRAGDRINLGYTATSSGADETSVDLGPAGTLWASSGRFSQDYLVLPWYTLQYDSQPGLAGDGLRVQDARGDVVLPSRVDGGAVDPARFDITGVAVEGLDASTTRVGVALADLSSVAVPEGYRGLLYAAGVATEDGRFMAGYYKDAEGPQEFFCAQDTVFGDTVKDPRDVIWTPIHGFIALGGRGAALSGSDSSAGTIALDVAHTCLGGAPPGALEASEVWAGSFLLEEPLTGGTVVHRLDDLAGPAVTLGRDSHVASTSWWAEPFDIEQFWDIAGVTFAVMAALLGAFFIRRRRRFMARYLKRVADAGGIRDAAARERALGELRGMVAEDLRRGKLTDGQFAVLERRLDSALGRARIASLTNELGDLPYNLVAELERFLADGKVTGREIRIVEALVDKARLPAPQRRRLLGKVRAWARQS
jgi:hypothetical protein